MKNWEEMSNEERTDLIPDRFQGWDLGACLLCDTPIPICKHTYEEKGVCGTCAEIICETYINAHSGEWFNWKKQGGGSGTYRKKPLSQGLRTKVFERDEYRCVHCGTHKELSVDHIHPEVHGGTDAFDNLQTLCKPCNSAKGDTIPDE